TTFAVLVALLLSRFHGQDDVNISYRRVPEQTVTKSIILALAAILVLVAFTTVLLIVEAQGPNAKEGRGLFLTALFEATSAFGTVGLSMGITPTLTNAGKLLIIVLMFLGRLGPLTLALAIAPRQPIGAYRYAEDEVMVG
ncbi:MAG: TrkH family potassium uptake protein, partial [Planctomycetes bacterium]|nr:TrkH family potassium uptake protein [Planctomycetota bacterium]